MIQLSIVLEHRVEKNLIPSILNAQKQTAIERY